jgi:hypothetical protein
MENKKLLGRDATRVVISVHHGTYLLANEKSRSVKLVV